MNDALSAIQQHFGPVLVQTRFSIDDLCDFVEISRGDQFAIVAWDQTEESVDDLMAKLRKAWKRAGKP